MHGCIINVDKINSIFAVLNKIATECWDYRTKTPPSVDHAAKRRAESMITTHPMYAVVFQHDTDFNWTGYFLSEMYLKVSFYLFLCFPYVVFAQQLMPWSLGEERQKLHKEV